ncbi:MAG: two-component regulator propeller domain-containing protein, partial [Chitinophagales bacterium]
MLRLVFLVSFYCCFNSMCLAQFVYMKHFTSADGLPSNVVYDVLQDEDGFIWFATDHGVSRFDGHHFKNFLKSDGIADDEIIRLGKDQQQRIWFLGFNGKASFYLHGKFYNENNSAVAAKTQLNSVFCKVLVSKKGMVYLVSNSDGFIEVNGDSVTQYSKQTLFRLTGFNYLNGLKAVKMDTSGQLLLFTNDSAVIFNHGKASPLLQQLPKNTVHGFILSDGSYVILGNNNLVRFTGNKTDTATGFEQNPFADYNSVEEDGNNNLWLMSKTGARLFRDKILDTQHQLKILDGKYCGHVFTDSEGNTWLAPLRDGVYMIPSLEIQLLSKPDGLANNDAIVLSAHPNGVIAGFANGIAQQILYDHGPIQLRPPVEITGYPVNFFPGKNKQWLCVTNFELITTDDNFKTISKTVIGWTKSAQRTKDGSLLLGGGQKLSLLKDNRLSVLYQFPHDKRIYAIAEDRNNLLWIGTEQGLFIFHDSSMQFLGEKFPALKSRISDLRLDATGRLWIASAETGLWMLENEVLKEMLATKEKISARNIFIDNNNIIYAGTDAGLFILKEIKKGNFQITRFRKQDGLASEKINSLLVKDGMIWIATDEGLQVFPVNNKLKKIT